MKILKIISCSLIMLSTIIALTACASSDDEMVVDSGAPFMVDFVPPTICFNPESSNSCKCNVKIKSGDYWFPSEDTYGYCPVGTKCTLIRTDGTETTGCTVTSIAGRRYCRCQ